jgi:hypothetical protein
VAEPQETGPLQLRALVYTDDRGVGAGDPAVCCWRVHAVGLHEGLSAVTSRSRSKWAATTAAPSGVTSSERAMSAPTDGQAIGSPRFRSRSSPLTSRIGLMTTDIVNNIDQRLGQLQGEIVKLETARTLLLDDGTSPGAAQPRHRGDRPGAQGRGLSPPERSPPCSPALMA